MQIGMIGLGRMGANMVKRLLRGGHECVVNDRSPDAIKALVNEGAIGAASLDVFVQEPQPADSRFWTHPKVLLTPHNAADTDADAISAYVAEQIAKFEAGGALENVVDRARGY